MSVGEYESAHRDALSLLRHAVFMRGPSWAWVEHERVDIVAYGKCVATGWLVGFKVDSEADKPVVIWVARRLATSTEPAQFKNFYRHTKALDWAENPESHANGVSEEPAAP